MSKFDEWWQGRSFGDVRQDSRDEDLAKRAFCAGMERAAEIAKFHKAMVVEHDIRAETKRGEPETFRDQIFRSASKRASKELDGFERAVQILKEKKANEQV
jgi:hypothetical protein